MRDDRGIGERYLMPCTHCNSTLILVENQWRCPSCDHLPILDNDAAVGAFGRVVRHLDDILKKHLQNFDSDRLTLHVLWQREKFARSYFDTYQGFHLTTFMSFNALIRRLMTEKTIAGGILADEANTTKLVSQFTKYIEIEDYYISVKNGFYSLSFPEDFDLKTASEVEMTKNLKLFPNETYLPVIKTFENNDILREKEAERKIQENKGLAEALRSQVLEDGRKRHYTSDQVIEEWYSVLNQLYCGLQRNFMFKKTFDLGSFVHFAPDRLMEFVNQFPLVEGRFTSAGSE